MPELVDAESEIRMSSAEERDDGTAGPDLSWSECWGCGAAAEYMCGKYQLCQCCAWVLAETGGAP